MHRISPIFLFILCLISSCKDSYTPKITDANLNMLVVEGMINANGVSTFTLSRTVQVTDGKSSNPERGAVVTIESESNENFPLQEQTPGTYTSASLNLNTAKKYRLHIKTASNANYLSDLVPVKLAPEIERVSWKGGEKELAISVSTSDATDQSQYYRWEYTETWIFFARYESIYIWRTNHIDYRDPDEMVFQCWGNHNSSSIVLGSSAKLDHDVINETPVIAIPSSDERLGNYYSILVKQSVLTKEGYEFWQNLKKNTESLGSIFDAQPSELRGNIRNTENPEEPVIGFVSAGTITEKRIFISKNELPPHYRIERSTDCDVLAEIEPKEYAAYFGPPTYTVPIDYTPDGTKMYGTNRECADCTVRGTNKKPAFWP
ncbi:hypothetical protein D9M68_487930 [compost metagenome]